MKSLKVTLAAMMIALFTVVGANNAQAQDIGQIAGGLVNLQIGQVIGDIETGDITVVNIEDTNINVVALNNVLNNSPILSNNRDILTNLLRDAEIITDNQVVVGILAGTILVQDL